MKVVARNKRAQFDFEITDRLEAGLVLLGSEVKSIKQGHVSLKGSYVRFIDGEPFLTNAHVSPYQSAYTQHEPLRDRKLLLKKSEIKQLISARQNGRHILPTQIGIKHGFIKLEIGIGTSRKKHDKRHMLKQRDAERDMARQLKR